MGDDTDRVEELKKLVMDNISGLAKWITTGSLASIGYPTIGIAASFGATAIILLAKLGLILKADTPNEFQDKINKQIIEHDLKIRQEQQKLQLLEEAWNKETDPARRQSLEDEIKTSRMKLEALTSRKLYLETLKRSLTAIETLAIKYGANTQDIYKKLLKTYQKLEKTDITDKEANKLKKHRLRKNIKRYSRNMKTYQKNLRI
jgi:hypothetical protein